MVHGKQRVSTEGCKARLWSGMETLVSMMSALFLTLCLFTSCETADFSEEETASGNGNLTAGGMAEVRILTRASDLSALAYPLRCYAFADDGSLLQSVTVAEGQKLTIYVPKDSPSRIVVLSADASVYDLSEVGEGSGGITMASAIMMRQPVLPSGVDDDVVKRAKGFVTSKPLQIGYADISPAKDNVTLAIQMNYAVTSLSVVLDNMPASCRNVMVSASPVYSSMQLGGAGEGVQTASIPLIRSTTESSTWTSGEVFLFPSSGNATTFTISYVDDEDEKISSVNYLSPLYASVPYTLRGAFADGVIKVTGDITPSAWGAPVSLDFSFVPGGTTTITSSGGSGENPGGGNLEGDDEEGYYVSALPTAMTLWNGHVVIDVYDVVEKSSASLLLMSLVDYGSLTSAYNEATPDMAENMARGYKEYDITQWTIPTEEQARILRSAYVSDPDTFDDLLDRATADPVVFVDDKGTNLRYLCDEARKTYSFKSGSSYNSIKDAGMTVKTYRLRLVREVKVKVKK